MEQGFLTTHVLDIYSGTPGKNIKVDLYSIAGGRKKINTIILNHEGRSEKPLLEGKDFVIGEYELVFYVYNYFKEITELPKIPFLNEVVIKFGISDNKEHYHIPLLVSPWSYSTYRGS
ncbi:MAG: 5-hydroxyisourate hydrolase [Alphaproteobacteria bacterium MarineAlpha5_Bin11]|nr:hydroxyisourate hydrolase [Pelagibacteraceae bacterium]PPR44158.1 MAG: 5-hydroxyisourate hydrolase [Alphaproteobacteria bacterium MarineAlpha5_Bin11]|tara:strand:+ start:573 stop:926 length:354 start_codon:yes stop_codon:yes gene_type:complete